VDNDGSRQWTAIMRLSLSRSTWGLVIGAFMVAGALMLTAMVASGFEDRAIQDGTSYTPPSKPYEP
jgi:hypothetical protein